MRADFSLQYKLVVFQFYYKYDIISYLYLKLSLFPVLPEHTQDQRHTCFLDINWDI